MRPAWMLLALAPLARTGADPEPPPVELQGYDHLIVTAESAPGSGLWAETLMPSSRRTIVRHDQLLEGGERVASKLREYACDFWPTAVAHVGGELLVAGKEDSGRTRIEAWTFAPASVARGTDGGRTIAGGERTATRLVSSEAAPRRGLVQALTELRGAPRPTALVLFHDSKDIASLDLETGELRLVVSSVHTAESVLVQPLLATGRLRRAFTSGDHVREGYLYRLAEDADVELPDERGDPLLIVLRDRDRDGVIDRTEPLTLEAWRAGGYYLGSSWR